MYSVLVLQGQPKPKRTKPYDKANLLRAYEATKSGMSVYRAARLYSVPESTLRDRTRCNVGLDAKPGPDRIFTVDEEKQFVEHVKYMADIGYGYTKSTIQYMASDFARSIGKGVKSEKSLSDNWFYGFLKRWSDLKMAKPQKLQISRAKSASQEVIDTYFSELGKVMRDNNLMEAPQRIYNIDETGISTEHAPPKIICSKESNPQAVTSERSANVTIIAGANAVGNYIPPFYVFPGKRWTDDLLEGAPTGSVGTMSDKGWSNSRTFEAYVMDHLAKHAALSEGKDNEATLIMYDGHKSHLSLTLTEWAKKRNVILYVLPPHTSHLTQPLDLSVFGPLKSQYYKECQTYLQQNPGISITRYEVAKLTAKPYLKALCPENIISGFRKSGIYPYNNKTLTSSQLAPATIYPKESDKSTGNSEVTPRIFESNNPATTVHQLPTLNELPVASTTEDTPQSPMIVETEATTCISTAQDKVKQFFNERTITTVVQRPKKKFIPPFSITGSLMKKSNVDALTEQAKKKKLISAPPAKDNKETKTHPVNPKVSEKKQKKTNESKIKMEAMNKNKDPRPSTSGLNQKGGPLHVDNSSVSSESESESIAEEDRCCVCNLFHPKELRGCQQLISVKWGQCDVCNHWTHLGYCTDVRVIRRGDIFKCPHCV